MQVAKFATNVSGAIWWLNLELMQLEPPVCQIWTNVEPPFGQILNCTSETTYNWPNFEPMQVAFFLLAGELTQVRDAIHWVRYKVTGVWQKSKDNFVAMYKWRYIKKKTSFWGSLVGFSWFQIHQVYFPPVFDFLLFAFEKLRADVWSWCLFEDRQWGGGQEQIITAGTWHAS